MNRQSMIRQIEQGFDNRDSAEFATAELRAAVDEALELLDSGRERVAEPGPDGWKVNDWLKKAVLLSFRLNPNRVVEGGASNYYDKVPLKFADFSEQQFRDAGVRVVPDAIVRRGAYIARARGGKRQM